MTTTPSIQISKQSASQLKPIPASEKLGFGNYFTDHLFTAKYNSEKGWSDAKIAPYGNISLDPAASVFHYGQALFEGMKVFRRKDGSIWCFRPEFNHQRFCDGATRLCLQPPPADLFHQGIRELVTVDSRWVPKEEDCSLYIRPTLIGTEAFLGVRPSKEQLFFVILSPVGAYYAEGSAPVKIWVESKALRAAPGGLGAVKAGANYAASLQAALDAKQKGYSQVLWLDVEKEGIEEVGTMNVFFVFKNEIVTPALNGSILPGGVRDSVLQLLKSWNKPVVERRITIQEIAERQQKQELLEAFGTGTAATISRIGEFQWDQKTLRLDPKSNQLSSEILATLTGIQRGSLPDPFEWMRPLERL
jgi:branched-chain amino acid aminotransferase